MEDGETRPPLFVALGGVWIDEIRREGAAPLENVTGGSVSFATLGARLFASQDTERVSVILRAGNGFPSATLNLFRDWRIHLSVLQEQEFPAARGIVFYGKTDSQRMYQRLTEPLSTTPSDLIGTKMVLSQVFHFFEIPKSLQEQVDDIALQRQESGDVAVPFIIWEPQAKSCSPSTLESHLRALKSVDVFSPNHAELASFFGINFDGNFDAVQVEDQARIFAERGVGASGNGCIVVRAAEQGCVVVRRGSESVWLPPFHNGKSAKVVDTTGAGNAFLGGFAIGYLETGSYIEAAKYGQVAASFAIEQVGLPEVTYQSPGEQWNGAGVRDRLEMYQSTPSG